MGSDAAIEAADIVLMDDDPLKIAKAVKISGKCLRIVYQNITMALVVKFACLEAKLNSVKQDENDIEEFIKRLKKYTDVQELTREMCFELIEYITLDECVHRKLFTK